MRRATRRTIRTAPRSSGSGVSSSPTSPSTPRRRATASPWRADWLDRHVFRHGWLGLGLGIALICLALGWPIGLLAAAIHTVLYIQINSSVNAVGHVYGRRPNQNSGTNGRLLALLSVGEGLHNNHHAAPTSARFSLRRGEIDLGWWCVATMRTLRLATVRHSEPKLRLTQTP
ncbi:MAG: hypothetical protein E6G60_14630 [Actinobacteria bacterium]|nr:MAG: hypothetical protein E6G60_14630 [Actinomycetota bacterium]